MPSNPEKMISRVKSQAYPVENFGEVEEIWICREEEIGKKRTHRSCIYKVFIDKKISYLKIDGREVFANAKVKASKLGFVKFGPNFVHEGTFLKEMKPMAKRK